MYYCNDLISKVVLSLYDGELIGQINRLFFDKKLKKLIAVEVLNDSEIKYILNTKQIYNVGKNAITIKNNQSLTLKQDTSDYVGCPIGHKTYSIRGEFLGIVEEIVFDEKFLTKKITLDCDKIIDMESIASVGKNTIILNDTNKHIDVKKFGPIPEPKQFKNDISVSAYTMPIEIKSPTIVSIENAEKNKTEFLIGRICGKDITNFNNEILIKANSKITKKNLKEIKRFGKIRELMLYLK